MSALLTKIGVVVSRIIVGATFIISGFAKCIDPHGLIYKIEDYLAAWGIDPMPSLETVGAFSLSIGELCMGIMLFLGCYRRAVAWLLGLTMAVMLPLTAYIMIADPVADCGCFGDMWVISNDATFYKNVVLSVLIVFLIMRNTRVGCGITPPFQWIGLALSIAYSFCIAFIGYMYQPLLDFRPFPEGTQLSGADEAQDAVYTYIYSKDGNTREFTLDSLPDDTWEFVDRKLVSGEVDTPHSFEIFDEFEEDVTSEVITPEGDLLLALIPDADNVGYSRTHMLRSFDKMMEQSGGDMAIVIAGDTDNHWRDNIGHGLKIYSADDTSIKELARGDIALVYVKDGIIQWKLDATSLPTDYLDDMPPGDAEAVLASLSVNSKAWLAGLTILYVSLMVVVIFLPWIIIIIMHRCKMMKRRKLAKIEEKD